jgi:hypothetical protein
MVKTWIGTITVSYTVLVTMVDLGTNTLRVSHVNCEDFSRQTIHEIFECRNVTYSLQDLWLTGFIALRILGCRLHNLVVWRWNERARRYLEERTSRLVIVDFFPFVLRILQLVVSSRVVSIPCHSHTSTVL